MFQKFKMDKICCLKDVLSLVSFKNRKNKYFCVYSIIKQVVYVPG